MPRSKQPKSGEGHLNNARAAKDALPSPPPDSVAGHVLGADGQPPPARPLSPDNPNGGEGQTWRAHKVKVALPSPPPIAEMIADIRYQHRRRCYAMESRKRVHLSLLALLRTALGWSKALPLAERKRIATRAMELVDIGEAEAAGKDVPSDPVYADWQDLILASLKARELFDRPEEEATKAMERLARLLPVYPWAKAVKGLGDGSLAVIVAEAGDLANYATHSKLWKRMGVAVMGPSTGSGQAVRQGGLPKSAPKALWIEHGYSRTRRSRLWNIGASLIKAQVRNVKDEAGERTDESAAIGPYGDRYLARKAYELARNPEMSPIHAHRRAQRYMEKRLLRDLWSAWPRDEQRAILGVPEMANLRLPAARPHGLEATSGAPEAALVLLPPTHPHEQRARCSLPETAKDEVPAAHPIEREAIGLMPEKARFAVPPARPNEQQTTPLLPEKASPPVSAAHGEGEAKRSMPERAIPAVPPLHPPGA